MGRIKLSNKSLIVFLLLVMNSAFLSSPANASFRDGEQLQLLAADSNRNFRTKAYIPSLNQSSESNFQSQAGSVKSGEVSRLIVKFSSNTATKNLASFNKSKEVLSSFGVVNPKLRQGIGFGFSVIELGEVVSEIEANRVVNELVNLPEVVFAEIDSVVTLDSFLESSESVLPESVQSSPVWGLDRIDQRSLPLDNTYTYGADGTGVKIYVVDSGINLSHTEFTSRIPYGYAPASLGSLSDCTGHGTHVSGTAAGTTYGVAKNATIIPVRVFDCSGTAPWSVVITALEWIASDHLAGEPAVVNMSLGGEASMFVDWAVQEVIDDGVTVVVASGNEEDWSCDYSPARVPDAITVNASNSDDTDSWFSNFGACSDIYAPGESITSAWYTSANATSTIDGTSMASPHVAGAAAKILQINPSFTPNQVWNELSNSATPLIFPVGYGDPDILLFSGPHTVTTIAPTTSYVGGSVVITGTGFSTTPSTNTVVFTGTSTPGVVTDVTTTSLTCANGGICAVGDIGPGGGVVYYVDGMGFSCGPNHTTSGSESGGLCEYLEVAPSDWSGRADPTMPWAVSTDEFPAGEVVVGITNDVIPNYGQSGIGLGYKNSDLIVAQYGAYNASTNKYAAGAARSYAGGSKNDWYLPTTAELNLLCQWNRGVTQDITTRCALGNINSGTGAIESRFNDGFYRSSSRQNSWTWSQVFGNGFNANLHLTGWLHNVRPVRAFAGLSGAGAPKTETALTVTVPAGAITGPVAVTLKGLTATSSGSLTVAPAITGLNLSSVARGGSLVVTGTSFSATPASNTVRIGEVTATVTAASTTSLTVTIPATAVLGGNTVSVTVATIESTNTPVTIVAAHTVTTIAPTTSYVGGSVVISGTGFSTTPASNTVVFTGTSTPGVVTDSTPLTTSVTCANGGICAVGDVGPGGGIVYYADSSPSGFACGPTLAAMCHYLEVAPSGWNNGGTPAPDPRLIWAVVAQQSSDVIEIKNDAIAFNSRYGIGLGYKNSRDIVYQGNESTTTAAGAARAYAGNTKNDWYLPTAAELNLLCQWNRGVTQLVTTRCSGGSFNTGAGAISAGLVGPGGHYWSSSEDLWDSAWYQRFGWVNRGGHQGTRYKDDSTLYVRPVRAFSVVPATATALTVTAPAGATTGTVRVTLNGLTVTSTGSLTLPSTTPPSTTPPSTTPPSTTPPSTTPPSTNLSASGPQFVLPNPLKVTNSFFKSLNASEVGSISVSQFAKLPVKTLSLLTPIQVSALTFAQLKALRPSQVVALKPSVIAVLNSTQIAALQPADFKLMKTTQIARISVEAASGLAKSDLNAFNRTQLRSLTPNAVKNLKPKVLKSLSVNKLRQFSPRQIRSLSDEQKSVLTKSQKRALRIK